MTGTALGDSYLIELLVIARKVVVRVCNDLPEPQFLKFLGIYESPPLGFVEVGMLTANVVEYSIATLNIVSILFNGMDLAAKVKKI